MTIINNMNSLLSTQSAQGTTQQLGDYDEEAGVKQLIQDTFSPKGENNVSITEFQTIESSGINKADIKNAAGEDIGDLLKITDEGGNTHFIIKSHGANNPKAQNHAMVYNAGKDLTDGEGVLYRHSGKDANIKNQRSLFRTRQIGSEVKITNNEFADEVSKSRRQMMINADGSVFDPSRERTITSVNTYTLKSEQDIFAEKVDTELDKREEMYMARTDDKDGWDATERATEYERLMKDIITGDVTGIEMNDVKRNYEISLLEESSDPAVRAELRRAHKASMEQE